MFVNLLFIESTNQVIVEKNLNFQFFEILKFGAQILKPALLGWLFF